MAFEIKLIKNTKQLKWMALAIFFLVFFILFIFEPFGDIQHGFQVLGILRIASYALVPALAFYLLERFIRPISIKYELEKQNRFAPLYWYFSEILVVVICIFLVRSCWIGMDKVTLQSFFLVLYRVLSIAIIPFGVLMILVYKFQTNNAKEIITFISLDKNPEYLKLPIDKILYLQSEDNYTSIFYVKNDKLKQSLLRGSLSHFQGQLNPCFHRIHRSHIVNLQIITHADYNSQGGKLSLMHTDNNLRISRKYVTDFKTMWENEHSL